MTFAIYHREREYAREMGDPQLAEIEASSKEAAERPTAHLGSTGTIAVPLPGSSPVAVLADGDRRGNYSCSLGTTTGYFAAENAAGVTSVHAADVEVTHWIPAHGRLTLWSCAGAADAAPAGLITTLSCPGNHLTALTVDGLAGLEHLDASFNDLPSIRLGGLPLLQTLILTKNDLTALDVRGLPSLRVLCCYGNQLTALDLTGRDRLQALDCSMNRLLSVKLGGCRALESLYCYCNWLPELDLGGLPRLRDFNLNRNPLAAVPEVSTDRL